MGLLQEAQIGRLGSRFSMNFRPREHAVHLSPMGRFYDRPVGIGVGVRLPQGTFILPFADLPGSVHFSRVEQEFFVEGVEFLARDEKLGIEFSCRFHSPFYPQDRKVSGAPFFYIELSARSFLHGRERFAPVEGEWFFSLEGGEVGEDDSLRLSFTSSVVKETWYFGNERPAEHRSEFSEGSFAGEVRVVPLDPGSGWRSAAEMGNVCYTKPFTIASPRESVHESLVIAAYQGGAVFRAWEEECRFLYTHDFHDIDSVIEYARTRREELLEKTVRFTETVHGSSLGEAARSLLACGFQNYLVNTWWVKGEREDHFFVWEGWCAFHSTLDVEYNNAWFGLLYWPELLEKQLDAWVKSFRPGGYPSHDLGILLEVKRQVYPHDMPVEESCNLLLVAFALWRWRGYQGWRDHLSELLRAVEYLLSSDTTGNGYPNVGVSNTIDDAAATVQYAREQTYLAIKTWSALKAISEMLEWAGEVDAHRATVERIEEMCARIEKTLDGEAWLGDHYAVCLPQSPEGLFDVWTGRPVDESDLAGWDAYSLYSPNGLLFLLAGGLRPGLDLERIRLDLLKAVEKSLTPYGCTHSSVDRSNVWLSQNLWRDQIAAYLGVDLFDMTERYWRFLEWENTQGRGGCFVDTYGWNWLSYYPRGVTAFGHLAALAGLQVNTQERSVALAPVRLPCRIPLLPLADWSEGSIPWLHCWLEGGALRWRVEGASAKGWRLDLASPEGEEAIRTRPAGA